MEDNSKEDNEINEILGENFNEGDYRKIIVTEDTIKTVDTYESDDREATDQLPIIFTSDPKTVEDLAIAERDGSELDSASVVRL